MPPSIGRDLKLDYAMCTMREKPALSIVSSGRFRIFEELAKQIFKTLVSGNETRGDNFDGGRGIGRGWW